MGNELIVIDNELVKKEISPADVFVHGGLDVLICEISTKAKEEVAGLDPGNAKDRKVFGAVCRKISSSKVFIETAAKNYVADLKAKIKPVDAERIRWVKKLDELKDEIDKPRFDWQSAQDYAIAEAQRTINYLHDAVIVFSGTTAAELAKRIEAVEQTDIESLPAEYVDNAEKMRDEALAKLYAEHDAVTKREAEEAELDKLRQEAAARVEADRKAQEDKDRAELEAKIKAEAAETAKREAEEKAAAEIKRAKEAQEAAERRDKEAEDKRIADAEAAKVAAAKAQEEAAAEIRKAKEAQEAAERREKEAAANTIVTGGCIASMLLQEAVNDKEDAERKERERLAEEKRIASKKHRAKIKAEATAAMVSKFGLSQDQANLEFDTYSAGTVPHISVNYGGR